MSNKIVLASNVNIGQNGAENDDEFLFKCFVDHPALAELRDLRNPAMFALGSTGIGKTALLRMLEKQEANCRALELHEMSMRYISNSDTIQFLQGIGVDLSLFFQSLWKHVICIEYIKLIGSIETQDRLRYWATKALAAVYKPKSKDVLENFLKENEGKFWNTIDENIIELTNSLTEDIKAELGGELAKYVAKAGYVRGLSSEKKTQLQQRARKFVNAKAITELPHVISALAEYTKSRSEGYFLTIDQLDEDWVEEEIKFELIRALFDSLKGLQKLRNFKVVVALRNDIYERMVREASSSQAQLEKYNDYILKVRWSKAQLKELADKRINHLFKWQYSSNDVHFDDIFKQKIDSREGVWSYLIERTLYRPRDVINFVNYALQASEGKASVSKNSFLKAQLEYSELRLETLKFEWSSTFPSIGVLLNLLVNRPPYFTLHELLTSRFVDLLYERIGENPHMHSDTLWKELSAALSSNGSLEPVEYARTVFFRLHLVGAVGLKVSNATAWQWVHETGRPILPHSIGPDTKVQIHPMLHFALNSVEAPKNLSRSG